MKQFLPYFLIADDDQDDHLMIQTVIDQALPGKINTWFVENGEDLIRFLDRLEKGQTLPALILLDLNMPKMDGRQALRVIKGNARFASIPIIILTTSQSEEDRLECLRQGADRYYQKTSTFAELSDIVTHLYQTYIV